MKTVEVTLRIQVEDKMPNGVVLSDLYQLAKSHSCDHKALVVRLSSK